MFPIGAVFLVLTIAVGGLEWLRGRVMSAPEYNPPVKLKLEYQPGAEWVEQEGWLPRITSSIAIPPDRRLMDTDLVQFVSQQTAASGWVRNVRQVSRGMDGTLRVCCDYRRPIAMVYDSRLGSEPWFPVDKEGTRLPDQYTNIDRDSGWIRILGVESQLPEVGATYHRVGEETDAVAAIRLAYLLFSQPEINNRISAIDVSNFNGRRDRGKYPIVVWPRDGGEAKGINWGSAIGREVEEPDLAEKVRSLVLWLRSDSPQARADLTVYRDGVLVSRMSPGLK